MSPPVAPLAGACELSGSPCAICAQAGDTSRPHGPQSSRGVRAGARRPALPADSARVCRVFIFKDTGVQPHLSVGLISVRQKGGLPGPPPRNVTTSSTEEKKENKNSLPDANSLTAFCVSIELSNNFFCILFRSFFKLLRSSVVPWFRGSCCTNLIYT